MSHLSSLLASAPASPRGEGRDAEGGKGHHRGDAGRHVDEAAARKALFGEEDEEEVPALWSLFLERQKVKEARMGEMAESIRESMVMVEAAETMERTVPSAQAGTGEEDAMEEDVGERKRELIREREERAKKEREREEMRRREREEAAKAREEEAAAQRERAAERQREEQVELQRMRERAEAAKRRAELETEARLKQMEEERKQEEAREAQRKRQEEEEERLAEEARQARAALKKQEDDKERERARRSTDWHRTQVLHDEGLRIERERADAARRRSEEQRQAREDAALAAARATLGRVLRCGMSWRRHIAEVVGAKMIEAACRRRACEEAYGPLRAQRRAAREAEEEMGRCAGHAAVAAEWVGDAPDAVIGGWSRRRRKAGKEGAEGGGGGVWAWCDVGAGQARDMVKIRADAAKWRASLPGTGCLQGILPAAAGPREEWVGLVGGGGGAGGDAVEFLAEHCAHAGNEEPHEVVRLELNLEGLTEVIPLDGMTSLRSLCVNSNAITQLPWGAMGHVEEVEARENAVASLEGCGAMTSLTRLNLDQNRLAGAGLKHVGACGGLPRLRVAELQGNQLESAEGLGACERLEVAKLYRNRLVDLEGLRTLQRLVYVDAGRNALTRCSGALTGSRLLEVMILYHNEIQAPPEEAGVLLKQLWLNSNRILGPLPPLPFAPSLQVTMTLHPLHRCPSAEPPGGEDLDDDMILMIRWFLMIRQRNFHGTNRQHRTLSGCIDN